MYTEVIQEGTNLSAFLKPALMPSSRKGTPDREHRPQQKTRLRLLSSTQKLRPSVLRLPGGPLSSMSMKEIRCEQPSPEEATGVGEGIPRHAG